MSQQLLITITAKDGASQTFRTVGTSATSMSTAIRSAATGAGGSMDKVSASATKAGASLNKAGSDAGKAATGIDKAGASASKAATDLDKFEQNAIKIGAALGTGVAALSKFGAQAETQRRQIDGLQRAYGDAADEIIKFTDAIQDSTVFSNEDAREAAQIAATLAQNYGFTTEEIKKLIAVSSDLAAVKGIDLADAVQRTSSAMRGEAESAEFLGLTLNQQAIDREGVTLSMSNEEAAHFRLNALLEQAAYAEGTAGKAAETAAGQAQQLANNIQDLTTGIGAALGPIAGTTAGLADMALILPVIGAGVGKLVTQFKSLPSASSAFTSLAGAINPIGLALTAVAVAGGIAIHSFMEQSDATAAAEASYVSLASAIDQVADAQARADLRSSTIFQSSETQGTEGFLRNLGATIAGTSRNFDEYTISGTEAAEANRLIGDTALKAGESVGNYAGDVLDMRQAVDDGSLTGDQLITTLDGLNKAFSYSGNGAKEVQAETMRIVDAWQAGDISSQGMADGVSRVTADVGRYADGLVPAVEGTAQLATELTKAQIAAGKFATEQGLIGAGARLDALAESLKKVKSLDAATASGAGFGLNLDVDGIKAYGEELAAAAEESRQIAADLRGQLVPALDGASHGFDAMAQPGEDVLDTLARLAPEVHGIGGQFLQFADNLNDAAQAMDSVLGMFGAIDSLGSQSSGAADIATKLVGEPGVWSTIDDLMANAAISRQQYNNAVAAGYDIQANDAAIQEDLNAIRANQLPLLDSQSVKLAAYVDGLAGASAAEQQQALYLMDSANQAKVAAAYSTAYAASLGEIPPEVATEIIADGAQADPVLGDILESFGLIEVGANGEITVNFPNKATLDDVVESTEKLAQLTAIQILMEISGGKLAADQLQTVEDTANGIDGKTVTAAATVNDEATPAMRALQAELDAADGRTVTATVSVKLDAGLASGAGFGAALDDAAGAAPEAITVPVEADTSGVERALASLETERTVTVKVDADTSAFTQALGGVDDGGKGVHITIDADDNASSVIARAMDAANAIDGRSYTASIEATDSSGSVVAQAMQAANAYAAGEYNASLIATDSASSVIAIPQGNATAFAVGEYNASLVATDSASSIIGAATDAATAFASTYTATLTAVDNASATIQSVANQLAALDGTTATTYVTTQEISSLPAKMLGGAIVPHAATGRVVQVGEAGPEAVVLPYGSMVQPSPASAARTAQDTRPKKKGFELPDVDLKEAYRKGGDSAAAFYDGLLDKAKSKISEARSALGSTVYGSKAEAEAALAEYQTFLNRRERIKNLKERGRGFDREQAKAERQAERAANHVERTMDHAADAVGASGAEAGEAFSTGLASNLDLGTAESAIADLNANVKSIGDAMRGVASVTDTQTEKIGDDLAGIADTADTGGQEAGENLADGLITGIENADIAFGVITDRIDEISNADITPQIGVDAKEATQGLVQTQSELGQLDGDSANIGVNVDDSAWQSFLDDVDAHAQLGVTVVVKTKEKTKKKLGGAILADDVPHAALGRVVTVGEAGPEAVVLPYGSSVIPHPASGSRAANEPRGDINIYAPVHIHAANSDVYGSIISQLTGMDRH